MIQKDLNADLNARSIQDYINLNKKEEMRRDEDIWSE